MRGNEGLGVKEQIRKMGDVGDIGQGASKEARLAERINAVD